MDLGESLLALTRNPGRYTQNAPTWSHSTRARPIPQGQKEKSDRPFGHSLFSYGPGGNRTPASAMRMRRNTTLLQAPRNAALW